MLKIFCVVLLFFIKFICGFNISPVPTYRYAQPAGLKPDLPKVDSSYFGFTIILRQNSVMIGAPRANSSLQRDIHEVGVIYHCTIATETCRPFVMDSVGNVNIQTFENAGRNKYTRRNVEVIKDEQWFGGAMDGNTNEDSSFAVCAPRVLTDYGVYEDDTRKVNFYGECFSAKTTENVSDSEMRINVQKIYSSFTYRSLLKYDIYSQFGFSVNVPENKDNEIVYGAPGFSLWTGTVAVLEKLRSNINGNKYSFKLKYSADTTKWTSHLYFGYAVTSAEFIRYNLMYVASGPRSRDYAGEVIIFQSDDTTKELNIAHVFTGPHYGEYFGYSLLADDFNGDGVIDMAISAPFHRAHQHDDGCVYIYINKGKDKFLDFKLQSRVLTATGSKGHAQFGTTLAKIGDINRDGFNDIAVGAPFETDGGAVYIFLGGQNGIDSVPSQIIRAPESRSQLPWFGYGISKGVDIDNNGHNDLAIGAPNIDEVYIYKAYPTIKINSTINVLSQININTTTVKLWTCMNYVASRGSALQFEVAVTFKIELDLQLKRAKFENGRTTMEFNITLKTENVCNNNQITFKNPLSDIYKPINITLKHKLLKNYHEMDKFCEDCVALNPKDPTFVRSSIHINAGCGGGLCRANLKLSVQSNDSFYLLGSASHIEVTFSVENRGDIAHDPKIAVYLPTHASFYLFPSWCERHNSTFITCSLRASLMPKEVHDLHLYINLNELDIGVFQISANATSSGIEEDPTDNIKNISINCTKFSDIQVIGSSLNNVITIEELGTNTNKSTITHLFEIRNYGPSTIRDLDFIIIIPSKYFKSVLLIERENISITGKYDNRDLKWAWADPLSSVSSETHKMTKRSYNRYTRAVTESTVTSSAARNTSLDASGLNSFAKNRTIFFNCSSSDHDCLTVVLKIENFYGGDKEPAAKIKVVFTLDEQELINRKIFNKTHDTFIMALTSRIANNELYAGSSLEVKVIDPITVFVYRPSKKTPLWVIIISVIIGIIILILVTFVLYKMKFFNRKLRDELINSKNAVGNNDVKPIVEDNIELKVPDTEEDLKSC